MLFDYLIWDFDGTLFDTYPVLNHCIRRGLADFGVSASEEAVAALLHETLETCIRTFAEQHGLDAAELEARVAHYQAQVPLDARPPFPGVKQVCERFMAAGGQNYIVTHRSRESLLAFLNLHAMTPLFAGWITRDDGYPRKPDPASFIALLERYNLSPARGLAIGDRVLDVLAGAGAGVRTCWFGSIPPDTVQPDYIIGSYAELERILGL